MSPGGTAPAIDRGMDTKWQREQKLEALLAAERLAMKGKR